MTQNEAPELDGGEVADDDGNLRLMLICSNTSQSKSLISLFEESLPGSVLHSVATARHALASLRNNSFDCVVLVESLRDHDCLALIGQLRDPVSAQALPVLYITLERDDQTTLAAIQCGATEVLASDRVTPETIRQKVETARRGVNLLHALETQRLVNELNAIELTRRHERLQTNLHETLHALRTPLNTVQESVSLIMDGLLGDVDERQGKFLALARGACAGLERELDVLHRLIYEPTSSDLSRDEEAELPDLLELCRQELLLEAEYHRVMVSTAYDQNLPPIRGDRMELLQALVQIVNTSIQAIGPGGRIAMIAENQIKQRRQRVRISLNRGADNVLSLDRTLGAPGEPEHPWSARLKSAEEILQRHDSVLCISPSSNDRVDITLSLPWA